MGSRAVADAAAVRPSPDAAAALRPLGLGAVQMQPGFWATRQSANRHAAIGSGYERLHSAGNLANLAAAARGDTEYPYRGPVFMDSDVYKWLEAAAWEQARTPWSELGDRFDEVVRIIEAAQEDDGYLNSYVQVVRGGKDRYADLAFGHELYCFGHLFQAAVAARRAFGEEALWRVALAAADHVVATFGAGGNLGVPGHPLIEMALVELGRESGEAAYAELARDFVLRRGHKTLASTLREPIYFSDRVPVRDAVTVEGHAVRAMYLAAGATDVALEGLDDDGGLLAALGRQWQSMVDSKMYLTGGLGSRWDGEAFGDPFELPPDVSYCETCAAIGSVQWNWRMLLATGEARFADVIERTLYNGMLGGVSLGGDEFFYVNPLQLRSDAVPDDHRQPVNGRSGWYDVACCPPNVMRTLASLGSYFATCHDGGVQLHQYAPATVTAPGDGLSVSVATRYPWDGSVEVRVESAPDDECELSLRVPAWCSGATVAIGAHTAPAAPGYWRERRHWQAGDRVVLDLPMPVQVTTAHHRVDAVRGCVALERGPLVYCVEQADRPDVLVDDVALLEVGAARWAGDLLGGVIVIDLDATASAGGSLYSSTPDPASDEAVRLTAIPYYAWGNRGIGPMRVWLPDGRRNGGGDR